MAITLAIATSASKVIQLSPHCDRSKSSKSFFNFVHQPLPYAEWAKEASPADCAGCHQAFVAKTDMTWVQFYPILRDGNKTK